MSALAQALELHRAGRFAEAAERYSDVPGDDPRAAGAAYLRAGALLRSDGLDPARAEIERAARLDGRPLRDGAGASDLVAHASVLARAGQLAEAAPVYETAMLLDEQLAEAHVGLGLVYGALGRTLEAAACFQRALRIDADCVPALLDLGTAWRHLGQREAALPCYRHAVQVAPDLFDAHYLLGTLLCELRELDEAIDSHQRALALAPDHPGVLTDLGSARVLRGEAEEGERLLRFAVERAPRWPVAHVNLGIALVRARCLDDALAAFEAALAIDPGFVYASFCESNLHLMRGDLARGYALYDAHRAVYPHRHRTRRWDGSPLDGRTILLYAQHGLGDTLQFVRYVPVVAQLGGRVVLEVQPSLVPLLAAHPGAAVVQPISVDPGPFDVQATLLELPAILAHTLETVPREVPYLRSEPARRERWRGWFDGGFKIGVVWHGNPQQKDGLIRTCALADMAPLWQLPGVTVYSLQHGEGAAQAREVPSVRSFPNLDEDGAFLDTAAIMDELDLIVTVDTSIAHLAGGLGRPVWMALPYWADWRWLLDRSDSPWYPTMRLFRQPHPFDWPPVFAEMAGALAARPRVV